jgi:hypothetical protein
MGRREKIRLVQLAVAAGVVLAIVAGALAVLAGVKAAERQAYTAYLAGSPCQTVSRTPDFVRPAELKSLAVGQATFRFLRGDADCTVLRPGLPSGDAERPVCRLDHPGYVDVAAPSGEARYLVAYGQASLAVEPQGVRCVIQPSQ